METAGDTSTKVQNILGGRLTGDAPIGDAMFKVDVKLGWAHEFTTTHAITQSFAGFAGTNFTTKG